MTRIQKILFILIAVVAVVIGFTVNQALNGDGQLDRAALTDAGIILLPQSRALPELTMIDEDGQATRLDSLKGQWNLLFFGYTFCPDICPTTLAQLRDLQGKLAPQALARLRVVMVSVDPGRDTPAQLKQYLGYFNAGFHGLTGELKDIQKLANTVSIPFIPADTSKPNYTVDHSGNLVIVGPDGRQRGFIRAPLSTQKLQEQLPRLLASEEG